MIARFFFCLISAGFILIGVRASAQDQAPVPIHKDGQSWQFKVTETWKGISTSNPLDGIYEVRVIGDKVLVALLTDGKREPVTARSGILRELLGVTQTDQPVFKFPLSAGQKWNYTYQNQPVGAKKAVQRSVEINVTGVEQVTTPAGTFKVFKIKKEDGAGRDLWVTTHFWSPEANSVVKSSYDTTGGGGQGVTREVELIKFDTQP